MSDFKLLLKNNPITRKPYAFLKGKKDKKVEHNLLHFKGSFDNRSRGNKKLCIILAGYKSFLYKPVFSRIIDSLTDDIDVCVVSSGVFSDELDRLCKDNKWSYLSSKENNVSLVQNAAISLHPKAKYIFKLDEDIFVSKDYFDRLFEAYLRAKKSDYDPGVIAPLLLINGFTSLIILDKIGGRKQFNEKFGIIKHKAGIENAIENNVDVARFFWGEDEIVPTVDELNEQFFNQDKRETACPIRFSIGAILFERSLWEKMHYFDVDRKDKNMMGKDEIKLCEYCLIHSLPVMVSENIVVGHFSFGPQTEGMKKYYKEHPERFA